jgi:hypothetical protein
VAKERIEVSMKIIVTTSDAYLPLIGEFSRRLVEGGLEQYRGLEPVTVLGYKTPADLLPANFEFVSLGEQPPNKDWTSGLISYFDNFKDDYFMLLLDDYMMVKVDVGALQHAGLIMEVDKTAMKFDLTRDRYKFEHIENEGINIIHATQESPYRSSLQAAIWRTSYFKKLLVPKRTAWEFELKGQEQCVCDGALILGTKTGIVEYENAMLKGKAV